VREHRISEGAGLIVSLAGHLSGDSLPNVCPSWIRQNPEAPAVKREAEEEWGAERSLIPDNSTPR
jgi:hypothetical protein